jgi:ABC-type multidrug transport system fused ATPase/permease subunit
MASRRKRSSILSYYVTILGRILRGRGRLLFVLASGVHALGHALVALVAGAVAVALAVHGVGAGPAAAATSAPATGLASRVPSLLPLLPRLAGGALSWCLVGLAVVSVKALTGVYATYVQGRVAGEVGAALRLELLDALLALHRLRRPRHDDHGAGDPGDACATARGVAALTEHVHEVEQGLKHGVLGGARALAQLVPLGVLLVALSPRTAAVACLALGVFGFAMGRARSGYRRAAARAAGERARLLEAADESVRHAELWVSYGAEAKARSSLRSLGRAIAGRAAGLDARAAALSGASEVLGALALAGAVAASRSGWVGPSGGAGAGVDGATLLAFAVAFFLAYRPLREWTESRLTLARARAAYEELAPILELLEPDDRADPRVAAAGPAEARAWPLGPLELRELGIGRGACAPLSLRVEPGSIVAIVGPTGVGKTTLLRTLLGLEPAAGGQVLFDGLSIGDAPAGPSSRPFAWVPQDAPLLADTLGANIALGADVDAARDALDPIGAAHLGAALGGARLGAGGRAVSGGERQWIALARAIATRQPVLLLDEPTTGLDAESQRLVLEAIASLRGRRTVLLVTHRPEPLAVADLVVRIESDGSMRQAA